MRYLYVLSQVGESVAQHMLSHGVPNTECETWLLHWENLLSQIAGSRPGSMDDLSKKFGSALKVSAFYVRRAESHGQ